MLRKTHLAIGLAVALHFFPHVNHKFLFIPVILLASLLPDIDSGGSFFGRNKMASALHTFTVHRGIFHSYTMCLLLCLIFIVFHPPTALPFFLGYSFHLLADSFTHNGIRPFWPLKFTSAGKIRVGGKREEAIFWVFLLLDGFLLLVLFI